MVLLRCDGMTRASNFKSARFRTTFRHYDYWPRSLERGGLIKIMQQKCWQKRFVALLGLRNRI